MTNEQIAYMYVLLDCGFRKEFDSWLDDVLEKQSPLSDWALDLSFCTTKKDKMLSVLFNYLLTKKVNQVELSNVLRNFLWNGYCNGRFDVEQLYSLANDFYHSVLNLLEDFDDSVWIQLMYFWDYSTTAIFGDELDNQFLQYLQFATPMDHDTLWNHRRVHPKYSIKKQVVQVIVSVVVILALVVFGVLIAIKMSK